MEAASDLLLKFGRLPERPKGADCKSAGNAYGGSNPSSATLGKASGTTRFRRLFLCPGGIRRLLGPAASGDYWAPRHPAATGGARGRRRVDDEAKRRAASDQDGSDCPEAGDGTDDEGRAVPGGDHPRCRAGQGRSTALLPGRDNGVEARSRRCGPAAEPSAFCPDRNGVAHLDVVDGRVRDQVIAQWIDQFITVRQGADARSPQRAVDEPRSQEMPRCGFDAVPRLPDQQQGAKGRTHPEPAENGKRMSVRRPVCGHQRRPPRSPAGTTGPLVLRVVVRCPQLVPHVSSGRRRVRETYRTPASLRASRPSGRAHPKGMMRPPRPGGCSGSVRAWKLQRDASQGSPVQRWTGCRLAPGITRCGW